MSVVTRFAPSPTGFLHIGGARTALFNWLFARHHGGKFLLRVEDTDRERSTQEAIDAILESMEWLELDWDENPTYQFSRADRHAEVAKELLKKGQAYYCFCSQEELADMREQAQKEKRPFKYDGRWRDRDPSEAPKGVKPVVRLKAPQTDDVVIEDAVQGTVTFPAEQMDDMILLRSDGTPTYMLAVVVDDHDMEITHVIRGDDHLTNAARQKLIYQAMGWDVPIFAHVPLIHGPDGAKLSKRHGALGVESYRDMGYLPETMRNYLLRLGWSHGDDEIISTEQAVEWFGLEGIGKSPGRLDFAKMENLNGHYIREASNERLTELVIPALEDIIEQPVDELGRARVLKGMEGLKQRAKTILELADIAKLYAIHRPLPFEDKAKETLENADNRELINNVFSLLEAQKEENWREEHLLDVIRSFAESKETKLGKVAQPLRAGLSGRTISPSVFEMMEVLGKEESLARLKDVC